MNARPGSHACTYSLLFMSMLLVSTFAPRKSQAQPAEAFVGITSASVASPNGPQGQNVGSALIAVTAGGDWFYQRTMNLNPPQPTWPGAPWTHGGNIFAAGGTPDRVVGISNANVVPPPDRTGCCDNAVVAITQSGDWYYQRVYQFFQASQLWPNEPWLLGGNIAGGIVRTQSTPWGAVKRSYQGK